MHGHDNDQPLKRAGFTLLELLVGVALASVVGLVCAGLFRAGIKSYNYSYRQTRIIYSARKAVNGDGANSGLSAAAQNAATLDSISASTLSVTPAGDFSTSYYSDGADLLRSRLATTGRQAELVSGLTVSYYNLDAGGRIAVSTAAETALLVTTQVRMKSPVSTDKTYNFYSGALLRNKQ